MLNLDEVKFRADVSELLAVGQTLDTLKQKADSLRVAASKASSSASSSSGGGLGAGAAGNAKDLSQSSKKISQDVDQIEATISKLADSMKIIRGEGIKAADGVVVLGDSFKATQTKMLASLAAMGATKDQLQRMSQQFKDFNDLTSSNTLDQSAGGFAKLRKEIKELTYVNELYAKGVNLTEKELKDLAREIERINQIGGTSTEVERQIQEYTRLAQQKHVLAAAAKESEKAAKSEGEELARQAQNRKKTVRETAKAVEQLSLQERQAAFAAEELNASLSKGAVNALFKYKERLDASGVSAYEAAIKMRNFRNSLEEVAAKEKELAKTKSEGARSSSESIRALREQESATKRLATEQERLAFIAKHLHDGLSKSGISTLFNYSQALKQSNISTQEAEARINSYKEALKEIALAEDSQSKATQRRAKAQRESAKASRDQEKAAKALAREQERLSFTTQHFTEELGKSGVRSLFAFSERMKAAGKSSADAQRLLESYKEELIRVNRITTVPESEKEARRERLQAIRDQKAAIKRLAVEEERLRFITEDLTRELGTSGARALYEFKRNLDASNLSTEIATQRLNAYRESLARAHQAKMRPSESFGDDAVKRFYREQERAAREAAKAVQWLDQQDRKLIETLNALERGVGSRIADKVARYANELERAGIKGEQAARRLDQFTHAQNKIMNARGKDQERMLARALSVQMGDVGISLAGGQNPLLVMIQQGDQIRGAVEQANLNARQMNNVMTTAAAQIAAGFMNTAKIIGGFFVSTVKAAGNAVVGFAVKSVSSLRLMTMQLTGFYDRTNAQHRLLSIQNTAFIKQIVKIGMMLPKIFTTVGLAAFGIATISAIKDLREMSRALVLNAGHLGLNRESALSLAKAYSETGYNTSKYVKALTEMAKTGVNFRENQKLVIDTALEMDRVFGIEMQETFKKFGAAFDDPMKALQELNSSLGGVSTSAIENTRVLLEQGNQVEAASVVIQESARIHQEATRQMEEDAGSLETAWVNTIHTIKTMWGELKGLLLDIGNDSAEAQLRAAQKTLETMQSDSNSFGADLMGLGGGYSQEDIRAQEAIVAGLQKEVDARKELARAKAEESERSRNSLLFDQIDQRFRTTADRMNQEIATMEKIARAAGKSEEEIARVRAEIIKRMSPKPKKPKKDASEGVKVTPGESLVLRSRQMVAQFLKDTQEYSKAQELLDKLQNSANWIKATDDQKREALGYIDLIARLEQTAAKNKTEADRIKEFNQKMKASVKEEKDFQETLRSEQKDLMSLATGFETEKALKIKEIRLAHNEQMLAIEKDFQEMMAALPQAVTDEEKRLLEEKIVLYKATTQERISLAIQTRDHELSLLDETRQATLEIQGILKDNFLSIGDSIVDMALTGQNSFKEMATSMIADIAKVIIKMQMLKAYENLASSGGPFDFSGGSSGGNPLTQIVTSLASGFAGGGSPAAQTNPMTSGFSAANPVSSGFSLSSLGGTAGAFLGTAAVGLIASQAMKGNDKKSSSGSSSTGRKEPSVSVSIKNYSGQAVSQRETVDSGGNKTLEYTIGQLTAKQINQSNSPVQKSLATSFGSKPQLIPR